VTVTEPVGRAGLASSCSESRRNGSLRSHPWDVLPDTEHGHCQLQVGRWSRFRLHTHSIGATASSMTAQRAGDIQNVDSPGCKLFRLVRGIGQGVRLATNQAM
jgi:hypothetical protein